MKRLGHIALGAALLMVVAAAQPVEAACVSARLVTTGASYVYTPGFESGGGFMDSSVSEDFVGQFWGIGSGDLANDGLGIDNGSFPAIDGWLAVYSGYPAGINTTWAASVGIDGCIDFAAEPRCMAMLLMDNDADNGTGAFALLTDAPDDLLNFNFQQPGFGPINLVSVPALSITGSVRTGSCSITTGQACNTNAECPSGETCNEGTGVDVSVGGIAVSDVEAGLYLDPDCPLPEGVLSGYQVYSREVPRGAPPPTDTNRENWVPVGPVTPLGNPSTVSLSCSGDTDQYLTTGIVFDCLDANDPASCATSSEYVSGSTTRFECGANLAEPEDIQRKPRSRELPRSRSRGR